MDNLPINRQVKTQRIPLLLTFLPSLAVVMSTLGLLVAAGTNNDVVRDDYYRAGMTINQDLNAITRAKASGVMVDLEAGAHGLAAVASHFSGQMVELQLIHPVHAAKDLIVPLEQGRVAAEVSLPEPIIGTWQVRVRLIDVDGTNMRLDGCCLFPGRCRLGASG